ncbi:MAG TPA: tetratricopeptide repeat protein [Chitinophagaceae bacterium]
MPRIFFAAIYLCVVAVSNAQTAEEFYKKGVALKDEKKSSEAVLAFREAVRLKPDYYAASYEMGWCYNDLKQYASALATLKPLRQTWSSIPKVFFETGYAFDKLNMIDSAIVAYNQCLQLKADYSLSFKQLGTIAYQKDEYSKALEYFTKYEGATKLEITDYLYWYRKGFMENAEKKYTQSKESLLKSLQYKKDYINTYLELGFSANKMKQADEAIEWFNEAMKLDAKSHIPYNGIAEVYRDTKKDMDQAINWYQKTLAIKTDERKACFGMGYCLNSKGRYSDAITYLKKAIQQESDYTAAYVELGYSYYMTNDNALALEKLNKAIELNPKNENARYYSGLVYISQKNKTQAQKMVDELKDLNSKNASTLQEKVNKM